MNNALLKDNLAARAVDSQTRKVFSRSGLIAGLCLSSLVSSYAIPGGVDATKAKNESVMITQQAKRVSVNSSIVFLPELVPPSIFAA